MKNHYEKFIYELFHLNFHIMKVHEYYLFGTLGYNKFFILFVEE